MGWQPSRPIALGRSRGGRTTKVHLSCEQHQKPLSIVVTAGGGRDRAPAFDPELCKLAARYPATVTIAAISKWLLPGV